MPRYQKIPPQVKAQLEQQLAERRKKQSRSGLSARLLKGDDVKKFLDESKQDLNKVFADHTKRTGQELDKKTKEAVVNLNKRIDAVLAYMQAVVQQKVDNMPTPLDGKTPNREEITAALLPLVNETKKEYSERIEKIEKFIKQEPSESGIPKDVKSLEDFVKSKTKHLGGGSGPGYFFELFDTPAKVGGLRGAYRGYEGKVVQVSSDGKRLEFGEGGGSVSDEAYGGTWDGVTDESPSKNAVYDKIQALSLGAGTGDVVGPISAVDEQIAVFDGTTGKLIKDGGVAISGLATAAQGSTADSASQPGHTHTASEVTDFDTEVANNSAVAANTSKVTNATHTGQVTGSGALTVDKTTISDQADTVITASDTILFGDATDTNNLKKDTVQGILDLVTGGGHTIEDEGTPLTQRTKLNFVGAGVTVTDDAGDDASVVTIPGGGGGNTYFNDTYIDQSGGTSDTYGVLAGLVNDSNTLYTVSQSAYLTGSLKVYLNGQLQTQGTGEDYVETTPGSGTFTFATAPATGDLITVEYQVQDLSSNTVLTDADLIDDDSMATATATNVASAESIKAYVDGAASGITEIVQDTTPQLGGNLDLNGNVITGLEIGTNVQAYDAQLDTWATVTPSANGQSLVASANYASMRGLLDVDQAGTDNSTNETGVTIGVINAAATSKTTPVNADSFPMVDSEAANVIKRLTFTNLKAFLKTYFDGLYQAAGSYLTSGGALGTPSSGTLTNCTFPTLNQNTTGNAATVTTNANLTGPITSVGNATTIADVELAAIAGLTSAADRLPYFTGSGTASLATFTAAARSIMDDASTTAIRTTLGVGTTNSPQFTAVNIGDAADTTLSRVSAGKVAVGGVNVVTTSSTDTLTNKTMIATSNVVSENTTTASSATPAPTGGSLKNFFTVTALATGATFAAPSGTPANGNTLVIRIKDSGSGQTLAWNAIYRAIGFTLPSAIAAAKTGYLTAIYNSADSKWDCLSYNEEA